MRVVCLLPARNCADDLPGYFRSISRIVDAVCALDDGSTDRTGEMLAAEPLVELLLRNPRRDRYLGWDHGENCNRLLRAARELEPDWIFLLDADERIAPDDRQAFKELVSLETEPPSAYLFHVFGMAGDSGHACRPGPWVGRLFPYSPDQVLPNERLHTVTIPTSIPPSRWRRTTVRIQHFGGSTEQRRLHRYRKYQEVDPHRRYQASYEHLLKPRGALRPWKLRPDELPVLFNATHVPRKPHDGPVLSAIVISRDDGPLIERTVASAIAQRCPFSFEVIAAISGSGGAADRVRRRFPQVRVLELDHPALPGEARNAGLRLARGRYVTFPGSHVTVEPEGFASLVRAHERGYAMVTGTMLNGTLTPAGWASYFLDNAGAVPGRPAGPLGSPPVRCSYLRSALQSIGGFPEEMRAGEDTVVNRHLFGLGYGAYREPGSMIRHYSPCRTASVLIKHHFQRGRGLGRILVGEAQLEQAVRPMVGFLIRYPVLRTRQVIGDVRRWSPELLRKLWRVLPLVCAGTLSAWAGSWWEVLGAVLRRTRHPNASMVIRRSG